MNRGTVNPGITNVALDDSWWLYLSEGAIPEYNLSMLKPRVYVETSIPSFYHELRTTPEVVARRGWTRSWWADAPAKYELVISPAVIGELSFGIPDRSAERLALIQDLPLLTIEDEITEIVAAYIRHKVMPADPSGDALHLAIASFHKCDFLSDLELPAHRECQQVRAHSPHQHTVGTVYPSTRHPPRIARSRS